jgi:hypothetical protein
MLPTRQIVLATRNPAMFGRLSCYPMALANSNQNMLMLISTSAIRKDIDSAAKYIGAGFIIGVINFPYNK